MVGKVHELEQALHTAATPCDRVDALNGLANALRNSDLQRVRELAAEAHALALRHEYTKGIADSLNSQAWCAFRSGAIDTAMSHVLAVCEMADRDSELESSRARALSIIGIIHNHSGDLPQALEHYLKAAELGREVGDLDLVAGITNDIGLIYGDIGDYDQALHYLRASLDLTVQSGAREEAQALSLNNIACIQLEQGDIDSALRTVRESLSIFRRIGTRYGEALATTTLGEILIKQGDGEQGRANFEHALGVALAEDCRELVCNVLVDLGRYYLDQGDADRALSHLSEANTLATEIEAASIIYRTHGLLAQAHEQTGDFAQALAHHKQFHIKKEVMFNREVDTRLKTMQALHDVETARAEREILRLRNEALEREIAEREKTEAERLARERLQIALENEHEINRMKTHIMERISHEFRTPLAIILTTAEMLTRYHDQFTPEKHETFRRTILEQVKHLHHMLNDILDVLRTTYDRLEFDPQPVCATQLCQDAIAAFREKHPAAHIVTELTPSDRRYLIDPRLFAAIISGLLDNAAKFTPGEGDVKIALQYDHDAVALSVTDQGIGIPPDEQAQVFEPLFLGSNASAIPGIGLGLTIIKDYVTLHNGSIDVISAPGQGSTFTVRLRSGDEATV